MKKLPFKIKIIYKDKNNQKKVVLLDEKNEDMIVLETEYSTYYLYKGCLNLSLAHLEECEAPEYEEEVGRYVVADKHWSIFYKEQTGLLTLESVGEPIVDKEIELNDLRVFVREKDFVEIHIN